MKNKESWPDFRAEYLTQLLNFGLEKKYRRAAGDSFSGILKNVLSDGKIVIQNQSAGGREEIFNFKEIAFVV